MKRRVTQAVLAVVGCLLMAALAQAQDNPKPPPRDGEGPHPERPRDGGPKDGDRPRMEGEGFLKAMNELGLSDEQKAKVKEVVDKFQADMKAAREKNGDELKKLRGEMQAAREAKDEARMKELGGQIRKLLPSPLPEQLKGVLTKEQGEKLREILSRGGRPAIRPGALAEAALKNAEKLGLTADQKTAVEAALKKFRDATPEGADEKARKEAGDKLMADLKAALGEDTMKKLLQSRQGDGPRPGPGGPAERILANAKDLGLTDEQVKQIKDLQAAFVESMKNAKEGERKDLIQKFGTDVRALLTKEQLEKLEKLRENRPAGERRPDGEKRPGGEDPPPPPPPLPPLN